MQSQRILRYIMGVAKQGLDLEKEILANVFKKTEGLEMIVLPEVLVDILLEVGLKRRTLHQENKVVLAEGLENLVQPGFFGGVFDNLGGDLELRLNRAKKVIINVEVRRGLPKPSFVKIQAVFD